MQTKMKVIMCAVAIGTALSGSMQAHQKSSDRGLPGTWMVKIYPQGTTAPLLAVDLNLFGCDGSETAPSGAGFPGMPPGVTGDTFGVGVGTYVATDDHTFTFSFYRLITAVGVITAYQNVHGTITLSASGHETVDHAQADFFDLSGNLVFSAQTDAYGTRMDTPSPRCD